MYILNVLNKILAFKLEFVYNYNINYLATTPDGQSVCYIFPTQTATAMFHQLTSKRFILALNRQIIS